MADWAVPADHPALPGHFPGHPVVPGVVILERVVSQWESVPGHAPVAGLDAVKFRRPLLPEQTARIRFQPPRDARVKFEVFHDERCLVSGQLLLGGGA